jgi:hypothetical protein
MMKRMMMRSGGAKRRAMRGRTHRGEGRSAVGAWQSLKMKMKMKMQSMKKKRMKAKKVERKCGGSGCVVVPGRRKARGGAQERARFGCKTSRATPALMK